MPSDASLKAAATLVVATVYRSLSIEEMEQMLEHGRHFAFDRRVRAINAEIEAEIQRRREASC